VVRIGSVLWFLERFCNFEMEWTEGSVIEFTETQRQCQPFHCAVSFFDIFSPIKLIVYGRSPAAIVGSNPTGGMDVCLL
jgi:hypothetical protein